MTEFPNQSPFYFKPKAPKMEPPKPVEQHTAASPVEDIRDAVLQLQNIEHDIMRLPQAQRALFASILADIQDVAAQLRRLT